MDPLPRPCSLSPSAATQPPGSTHGRGPAGPRSVVPNGSPGFGGHDEERGDGRDHDVTGTAGTTGQGVDDWIVSDEVTSLMLAQLSERTELAAVFLDLFSPDGARLSFRPAHRYVGAEAVPF